jgi:hypothetical protein
VTLVLIALVGGLAAGYARGGRLTHVTRLRLQRARLLGSALGARVLGVLGAAAWEPLLPALTAVAVGFLAVFGWVNRRVHGVALTAAGVVLDAVGRLWEDGWLGPWVPVAFPPRPETVSPGGVLLAAGLGLLLATAMTEPPVVPPARETIGDGAQEKSAART